MFLLFIKSKICRLRICFPLSHHISNLFLPVTVRYLVSMSAFLSAGWAERMLEMFSARDLPCSADCSTPNNRAGSQWRVETPGYKTWSTRDTTLNDKPPRWHYHIRKQQPPDDNSDKINNTQHDNYQMTTHNGSLRWQSQVDNPEMTNPDDSFKGQPQM